MPTPPMFSNSFYHKHGSRGTLSDEILIFIAESAPKHNWSSALSIDDVIPGILIYLYYIFCLFRILQTVLLCNVT